MRAPFLGLIVRYTNASQPEQDMPTKVHPRRLPRGRAQQGRERMPGSLRRQVLRHPHEDLGNHAERAAAADERWWCRAWLGKVNDSTSFRVIYILTSCGFAKKEMERGHSEIWAETASKLVPGNWKAIAVSLSKRLGTLHGAHGVDLVWTVHGRCIMGWESYPVDGCVLRYTDLPPSKSTSRGLAISHRPTSQEKEKKSNSDRLTLQMLSKGIRKPRH